MANPEHVALVRKGAKAIDDWRRAHPDERLNLSKADLSGANLSGASLHGADLFQADLSEACLSGARLVGADLGLARAPRVDLTGAKLNGAHLTVTDLSGANLTEADFGLAYFWATNLSGAILSHARLSLTSFTFVDLSTVKALATVDHSGPSSIGVDTLILSLRGAGGKPTPELTTFFLGAGVPKELLDALPDIVREVKHYSCFISYGQPDVELAKKLCEDLEVKGVPCWLYDMDKTPGKRTWAEIGEARRGTDKFVALCSAAALVRDGVLAEIEDQVNEDPERLVPISLDDLWREPGFRVMRGTHDLKPDLVNRNYADFSGWDSRPERYEKALEDLLRGLKREKQAD